MSEAPPTLFDYFLQPAKTLEEARVSAGAVYDLNRSSEAEWDGPDTLDEVEAPARALLRLLDCRPDNINCLRLTEKLTGDEELYEFLRRLDAIRLAASKAHQKRRRGRPGKRGDLRAAAHVLIEYWKRTEGRFTNLWDGLEPISKGAKFLFEELRRIDPKRPRLPEQLRGIMAAAVAETPGSRRGRKVKTNNNVE